MVSGPLSIDDPVWALDDSFSMPSALSCEFYKFRMIRMFQATQETESMFIQAEVSFGSSAVWQIIPTKKTGMTNMMRIEHPKPRTPFLHYPSILWCRNQQQVRII